MSLNEDVKEILRKYASPGRRMVISCSVNGDGGITIRTNSVCDGENKSAGYQCALKPGHHGLCYTNVKHVDFDPLTGGPEYFVGETE